MTPLGTFLGDALRRRRSAVVLLPVPHEVNLTLRRIHRLVDAGS